MTVMMSLLVRPNFPLSTFAKGKLHANEADLPVVDRMSLNSNRMERSQGAHGKVRCGNAQRTIVANCNAQE